MTDDPIAAARRDLQAATPGPWLGAIKPNGKGVGLVGVKAKRGMDEQGCIAVVQSIPGGKERAANVHFIANAPTHVANLLAVIDDRDRKIIKWKYACLDWQLKWQDERDRVHRDRVEIAERDREIERLRGAIGQAFQCSRAAAFEILVAALAPQEPSE